MILQGITSFNEFKNKLSNLNSKEKGDCFEELTKKIFISHPNYSTFTKNIYLQKEIPLSITKKLNLPLTDKGIDLVLEDTENNYWAIQCKYRTNEDEIITWDELSTFYGLTFGIADGFKGGFLVTNTSNLNPLVSTSKKIISLYGDFFTNLSDDFISQIYKEKNVFKLKPKNPKIHQQIGLEKTIEYLKNKDRGIIEIACGGGKTYLSWLIDNELKNKITIIAVPSLYLLSQFYNEYSYEMVSNNIKCQYVLCCSDADVEDSNGLIIDTDYKIINSRVKKILKMNKKLVIITTYQSSDIIIKVIKKRKMNVDLCVYDEAHKTVGDSEKQFGLLLNDNIPIKKRIFMTATPKHFNGSEDLLDDELKINSMNDEKVYGNTIYKYNIYNAIKDKNLVDYQFLTMITESSNVEKSIITNKYIRPENDTNKKEYESEYFSSGIMIAKAFKLGEIKHLITYHNKVSDTKEFKSMLEFICKHMNLKIDIYQIDGKSSMKSKNNIIKEFTKSPLAILTSARVLNEGVNIPVVDSVCFIDNRFSLIDIIQCIGRALRLDLTNPTKLAKIIIPIIIKKEDTDSLDKLEYSNGIFGNLSRIIKMMSSVDEGIVEYFTSILNGKKTITERKILKNINYLEQGEVIATNIKVDDWIKSIGLEIWKNTDSFNYKFELFKEFVENNGRCPIHKEEYKDIKIGRWFQTQKGKITSDKSPEYIKLNINSVVKENLDKCLGTKKLNEDKPDLSFDEKLELFKGFVEINNRCPIHKEEYNDVKIGIWFHSQKGKITSDKSPEYIKLNINPIVKENLDKYLETKKLNEDKPDLSFDEKLELFKGFVEINNRCPVQKEEYNDVKIGIWFHSQKGKIISDKSPEYIKLNINPIVKENLDKYLENKKLNEDKPDLSFDEKNELFKEFVEINNRCPVNKEEYKNVKIYNWFQTQKGKMTSDKSPEYIKLNINPVVEENLDKYLETKKLNEFKPDLSSDEKFELFKEFVGVNNRCPINKEEYKNVKIGIWFGHYKGKITSDKSQEYIKLNINSIVKENLDKYLETKKLNENKPDLSFDEKFELFKEFVENNGRCPKQYEEYKNVKIYIWFHTQKGKMTSDKSPEYIKLNINLIVKENLDKYLETKKLNEFKPDLSFDKKFELFREFVKINDRCPKNNNDYKGVSIGKWFQTQKKKITSNESPEYIKLNINPIVKENLDKYLETKKLNEDKPDLSFDEKFELFWEFVEINNRCPVQKEEYKNIKIGSWFQDRKKKITSDKSPEYIKLNVNPIVKENLDKFLENKKLNGDKPDLSFDEKFELFKKFVEINSRCPKNNECCEDIRIGSWFGHQKAKITSNKSPEYIKLNINPIVKDNLDKYLENKNLKLPNDETEFIDKINIAEHRNIDNIKTTKRSISIKIEKEDDSDDEEKKSIITKVKKNKSTMNKKTT
jgi:superfamily II DNA or RNA helicase